MANYADTRATLVEKTLRSVNDWVEGTATGGGANTVQDTSRPEVADYFNSKNADI